MRRIATNGLSLLLICLAVFVFGGCKPSGSKALSETGSSDPRRVAVVVSTLKTDRLAAQPHIQL